MLQALNEPDFTVDVSLSR